jgi:cellulose biosynthesis protein BcsQ
LERCPKGGRIAKIIPNNYRNVRRHNAFIAALCRMFAGRVTATRILADSVFDEVATEGKILFLHRLYSKGAACYVKLVHELFADGEEEIWEALLEKRGEHIRERARERYVKNAGGK